MTDQNLEAKLREFVALKEEVTDLHIKLREYSPKFEAADSDPNSDDSVALWDSFCLEHELWIEKRAKLSQLETELRVWVAQNFAVTITDPKLLKILRQIVSGPAGDQELALMIDADSDDDLDMVALLQLSYEIPPKEFFKARLEIGPLITHKEISGELRAFLNEAREAYILGLPNSVNALCRTALERAAVEIAQELRPSEFHDYYKRELYSHEYPPGRLFDNICKDGGELRGRIKVLYARFSETIHGGKVARFGVRDNLEQTIVLLLDLHKHAQFLKKKYSGG